MVDRRYVLIVDELAAAGDPVQVTSQLVTGLEAPKIVGDRVVELAAEKGYYLSVLSPVPIKVSEAQGPKRLSLAYEVTGATRLSPLLLSRTRGGREPGVLDCSADDKAVCLTVRDGNKTDYLLLNVTGRPVTRGQLTSDARVTLVRQDHGKVARAAVVWGSRVSFGKQELLRRSTRVDYSTP